MRGRRSARLSLLDLCSYLGLGAVGLVVVTLLLGMLLSLRYSPVRLWPHRRINQFALHSRTAYGAIALIQLHPAVLPFLHTPRFRLIDLLWPIHSPLQPKLNLAGAAAAYLLLLVLMTSLHSILTDPNLRDGHPDLLDGGKVFLELSLLLIAITTFARVRFRQIGFRASLAQDAAPFGRRSL